MGAGGSRPGKNHYYRKSWLLLNCYAACVMDYNQGMNYHPAVCANVCGNQPGEWTHMHDSPDMLRAFLRIYFGDGPAFDRAARNEMCQMVLYAVDGGRTWWRPEVRTYLILTLGEICDKRCLLTV